ncbi:MAG TPA: hypothetical protein VGF52_01505 [Tepidisphaeraceae bacterium]|jgi:hypothetical protein
MMAKMFYTLDETKSALAKNEEEIKQYTREGRLREFRDGPRLMFKADQVEALKNELGVGSGSGLSDTNIGESGAPIGLIDSRTASATGISLVDSDTTSHSGLTGAGMQLKDDTAMGDLGSLGGTATNIPSPSPGVIGTGSMAGTRAGGSGINVLGESATPADPAAQTAISSGVPDQISLEGVGSGSGLLDLTRESDDTSLGAELLDEIAPGGTKRGSRAGGSGTGAGGSTVGGGTVAGGSAAGATGMGTGRRVGTPIFVEAPDSLAPALGGAALGAVIMIVFAGFALMSAVMDTRPPILDSMKNLSMLVLAGIGFGVAIIMAILGAVLGKVTG